MSQVLFICTGNIFRSMTAEYALRKSLGPSSKHQVRSAGIEASFQVMRPQLITLLAGRGVDCTQHQQTKLTRELLDASHTAIAMGVNHQLFVDQDFNRHIPLFNEVCFQRREPVLDVNEALPDWETRRPSEIIDYIEEVLDHIFGAMPYLIRELGL
jgi:protein-tyrosine phosphatase